jgi:hypothetical protein
MVSMVAGTREPIIPQQFLRQEAPRQPLPWSSPGPLQVC